MPRCREEHIFFIDLEAGDNIDTHTKKSLGVGKTGLIKRKAWSRAGF